MSVRVRLTLWHTALLALILACFAALVYAAVARQMTSQLDHGPELALIQTRRTDGI